MTSPFASGAGINILEAQPRETQSITTLLRRLSHELLVLFRQELHLASTETSHRIRQTVVRVALLALGGAILLSGVQALLAAAILGLATQVSAWLAALIVGLAVSIAGGVTVLWGARKLKTEPLTPERSARSLRKDKDVLTRRET